jgi:vitamin B12 transporter
LLVLANLWPLGARASDATTSPPLETGKEAEAATDPGKPVALSAVEVGARTVSSNSTPPTEEPGAPMPLVAEPAPLHVPAAAPVEVVVHGESSSAVPGPRDASVAGSLIRRDRLVGPGLQMQDLLRTQPGVAVTESGGYGSPATAALRGATAADTPVYLGGVRLNDDVGGTADLSLVPLWLIDHVEIYRGHSPIDADWLTPGGSLFFEPRRPTKPMGGVGYYGGSLGVSKGWAYAGTKQGGVSALMGISADRASNRYSFVNDHGTLFNLQNAVTDHRRNSDERTLEGWGAARAEIGRRATLDLLANGFVREQGVPRLALVQTRRARGEHSRVLASVALRVPIDEREHAVLSTRTSFLRGSSEYQDPLYELNLRTQHLSVVGTRLEQSVSAKLDVTETFRLQPFLNFAHESIEREPDNIPLGRARREFVRTALGAQQQVLDWFALHGLFSAECHHTGVASDTLCDQLEPTGRLGLEFGEGHLRVLANVGRYVRIPTLGELYGVSGSLHGNASLAPENSYSTEFGIRAQTGRSSFFYAAYLDAFVFSRWAQNLIAYQRAGEGFMVPYNVGRARLVGAEILTGLRLTSMVRTEISATLIDPRDTTSGRTTVNDVLPYRSRAVLTPRVRADWKADSDGRPTLSGAGGELCATYQSSRLADPAGLGVIAAQATVDLEAYLAWFDGVLATRARISDLFDAKRTDIIGYPLPGRSGYFGLEATW